MSDTDRGHMQRALALAERGLLTTTPNPRVGCVLVRDGEVIGEGWHRRAGGPHAEVAALDTVTGDAAGATAYVTLEPCSHRGRTGPCADALVEAHVARVVMAMTDPNPAVSGRGRDRLRAAGIETATGLCADEAEQLNAGYVKRMRSGRPLVRLKLAMSLDGRTALASGESRWITGEASRADVQRLRARSCAVMTGVGTLVADDPRLDVRLSPGPDGEPPRQPLRVVLDSRLSTTPAARTLAPPGAVLVLTCADDETRRARLEDAGAEVAVLPGRDGRVDLEQALDLLGERGVNELHVEAGATLAGALLAQALVDELVVYTAPVLLGSEARALAHLPGIERMEQRLELALVDVERIGEDIRISARPRRA